MRHGPDHATAAGASVTCPICDTVCAVASPLRPRPTARPEAIVKVLPPSRSAGAGVRYLSLPPPVIAATPSNRRRLVLGILGGMAVFYLLAGVAVAVYFLHGNKAASGPSRRQARAAASPAVIIEGLPTTPASPTRPAPPTTPATTTRELTEEQKQVNAAIDKGVVYLKAELKKQVSLVNPPVRKAVYFQPRIVGTTALMGLTLLECGVPAMTSCSNRPPPRSVLPPPL